MKKPTPSFNCTGKRSLGLFLIGTRGLWVPGLPLVAWYQFYVTSVTNGVFTKSNLFFTLGNAPRISFNGVGTVESGATTVIVLGVVGSLVPFLTFLTFVTFVAIVVFFGGVFVVVAVVTVAVVAVVVVAVVVAVVVLAAVGIGMESFFGAGGSPFCFRHFTGLKRSDAREMKLLQLLH